MNPEGELILKGKSITSISIRKYQNCKNLKVFDARGCKMLTMICSMAFKATNLMRVFLPQSVTDICSEAFANCKFLKKIVFDGQVVRRRIHFRCLKDSSPDVEVIGLTQEDRSLFLDPTGSPRLEKLTDGFSENEDVRVRLSGPATIETDQERNHIVSAEVKLDFRNSYRWSWEIEDPDKSGNWILLEYNLTASAPHCSNFQYEITKVYTPGSENWRVQFTFKQRYSPIQSIFWTPPHHVARTHEPAHKQDQPRSAYTIHQIQLERDFASIAKVLSEQNGLSKFCVLSMILDANPRVSFVAHDSTEQLVGLLVGAANSMSNAKIVFLGSYTRDEKLNESISSSLLRAFMDHHRKVCPVHIFSAVVSAADEKVVKFYEDNDFHVIRTRNNKTGTTNILQLRNIHGAFKQAKTKEKVLTCMTSPEKEAESNKQKNKTATENDSSAATVPAGRLEHTQKESGKQCSI